MMIVQVERQKSDVVSQCQKTTAERDEAIQANKFLQSKLREAEIALKELGQNVTFIALLSFCGVTVKQNYTCVSGGNMKSHLK